MIITNKDLEAAANVLNRITKNPVEMFKKRKVNGRYAYNLGHYHIDSVYGGEQLVRTMSSSGAISVVSTGGCVSKRELYNQLHAMIKILREPKKIKG